LTVAATLAGDAGQVAAAEPWDERQCHTLLVDFPCCDLRL
jgi:hypothetical protein